MDSRNDKPHDARDAVTGLLLGGFLMLQAIPILAAVLFVVEDRIDKLINISAGLVIFLIGLAFVLRALQIHRRSRTRWTEK